MIHSDNMLGNGVLTLGNLDFNAALEASGRPAPPAPDRSFLDAAIDATDINQDAPRQLEPVVNPMQRLTDVCLYDEDEEAAERVKDDVLVTQTARGDVFGQNMLIGVELADMMTGGDVYETAQRFIGVLPREQQQAWRDKLDHCQTQGDGQALVGEMFRNGVVEQYRANKAKQEALEEERGMAFNGVFSELVKDANNEEAWKRFREGQARGAFTDADKKALDSAARAWGMMEMLMDDYSRSGAAVLLDNESGERIFNELYGDEAAQAVFLNVLNNEVQDLKNDASRRNALVRFGQAFAASTNNLMAGVIGGKFKAFVTDEQVDAYNREWERARELSGRENPNVAVYAEGDNWVEKYLLPGNARIDAIRKAAQESGQMNQDGSLRKMTAEERKGTQELGAFRGQLFNAVQGMYDVPGVVAKLGKMMPDSLIYLVPGGMLASAGSMHTQELARRSGEGEDYVSANTKAAVEAGISAAVEKLAFGSLKPARMAPGLDWLMSRKVVGQALGKIYGSTAGRIGLGVVAGSAEETFAEPLAGLIMRGVYNVAAADELQLADPLGAYRKEMEEMLAPDQILVTGLYGLLLGGVSAGGHMQAAEDYREMYEHLVSIGVDEGRAAQAARDDAAVAGFKATKALFDEAVKKDTKGVIAYLAELYPQIEPLNVAENLFSTWQLPHLIPAENGQVKVQEKDEDGKVTETLMSKEAADLLVQARLEQMKSSEIAKFANQLLGAAMAGKASSETDRFIVEEVDGAMDADYFTRLANAAGVRLQQGARADEVDPEIHQHLTLGQLVQQGQAWEQRMEIQRNEVDRDRAENNLPPLTDEEWAERKKAYAAAVNRQSVRGADGRKRTLLRVSRGHYGAMNVLEDLTEDFIARDMAANNRGLEWYVQNIRELETALGRQNEFLRELGEGKKPVNQMDIIEAVGKIAQSKLLADTVKGEHGFSAALKSFLEMIRTLILKAAAMLKLGKAINQALTDETVRGKMDTEFLQLVDDVVAQDIEFLRELQLEDGLKAMQRVIAARQDANADTRVKRHRKAKTPVLDEAEKNHGKEVREAARKKAEVQAKVDADVEVAEAALEGDFSSSVTVEEFRESVGRQLEGKEAERVVDFNGIPVDVAIDGLSFYGSEQLMQHAVYIAQDDPYFNARQEWVGEVLPVLEAIAAGRKKMRAEDIRNHLDAGRHSMPIIREAIEKKMIPAPPNKKDYPAPKRATAHEAMQLHAKRNAYFNKRKIEVLDVIESMLGEVRSVDLSRKSSSTYYETPIGNIRLSDHALPYGRFYPVAADLRFSDSDEQVKAKIEEAVRKAKERMKLKEVLKSMSVTDAQERGLFEDGVLEASNAVVTEPSFSIEALHATPHRFRKFDMSKMGSGEGHQAFGWGLYFAESEDVNRDYHRQFSQQTSEFIVDGKKVRELDLIEFLNDHVETDVADYALMAAREDGDIGTRIKKVQDEKNQYEEWLKNPLDSPYADWQLKRFISGNKAQLKALRFVKKHKIKRVGASNYRVELNVDDGSLLMWDTPVSDKLQREVENLQRQPDKADLDAVFAEMKAMGIRSDGPKPENMRGYQVYNELARILGGSVQDLTSPRFGQGPKLASEWLLARGIRGIKYFDGYSRVSKGENKTYNYVIFSGDDVKITGVNETGDYNAPWEVYEDTDASFSVFSPSEASGLSALQSAVRGKQDAVFRSDTLNADVMLPFGSAGVYKNPDNPKSKIVGAHGLLHIITARMAHGDSLEEATYTAVKVVLAAVNGRIVDDSSSENKKELTLDGYNTWVYLKWRAENKAWVVTGYKENDKHSSVDDRQRAMNLAESYALNTFGGLERVGAALEYSIARVAREYKQNNANPFLKLDFSSSLVNLDEESVAREVVDAGQGFRANLAYSEAIMREMRGAMQRLRKLGSKTRTDREDAVAAMGTMVQMVKAAVAVLPKGYRFSVHPYLNRIEALAELAATGDIDLTSDIASKDILQLENAEGVDLKKPYDEMVKEYGNVKLAEALERIMHRVSEQLRKHAKDRAVEKITELVERLAPKKDPKTGKLKGGKMSADAYRDLATVAEAMGMNSEQLEAKLAALRADMAKPGISEELREQLEDEMTLYDQFGDLAGMTAEDAVAAYEALRVRIYFHRFEWDDKQARVRGARRAVVRRVVDGVGSVSENEYNAKKRRVKPSQRLKNLGDILSGMPAALAGMRGYLPLRQMADELALRANAAGEAIKAWEAERWLALEALCKETMGKSWRECMDFMHKVQPSGVSFDRPKFRTVNVKTEELRELLAMTKEERKAEMKRRRESGGLEAERALSERDVQELQKKLEAMEEEGRVLSRVETRYMVEVQHEENLQLSRGEALYAILMFEQPTYTERLIMQGYTFEVIEGLREYVGDGMLQFGYGLRELFAKQGDRIAAVYENAFGVPFPREENYFAARWVVNGMKENPAEQLLAGMAGTAGAGNGWMKQRVNHNLELDMTKDALQVFLQATSLTDTWMATQDIVADFKAWTRDADFERALTAVLGKESYDNLKDWIRILEMGGVQDCLNMGVSQDIINGLYGSGAVAILGLRIQTLLKQTPAIFNGLLGAHDISAAEWFATMSRMKNGDAPMTYKRMVNSTLIKMRQQGKAGYMAGQAMRSGDTASSAAEGLLMASMLPMEWVDARCTAIGLVPVWNVYYQRAVDQGASAQEAEQAAWEQTALVANLASQPIGWLNKSKIAQNQNPIIKSVFYMLSPNLAMFSLCRALWREGKWMAATRAWLVYGAANAAISAMLDALQGDPEEFEKGKWWEYMFSAFYGPAAGLPGVGEALEAAVNALLNLTGEVADIDWMKKMKTRASAGRALVDFQGGAKALIRVWGYMTDNKDHSLAEYTRAVGTVSRMLAIGTGWMGNMFGYWSTAVAVLMNPIDFGARVWRNMKHYWD